MSEDGSTLARRQRGKYLRDGREGCGFTLAQAAALIERSGSTLQRIEKGTVAQLREVDSSTGTRPIGNAGAVKGLAEARRVGAAASATEPQAWHSPQRPTHLAVSHPHSVHR